MQTPSSWYRKHPGAARTVRKQHSRKVVWRTSAPEFNPALVATAYRR